MSNTQGQKVVVIVGRTATGKSDIAVRLARTYNGEVISADSRQVYTGLNIGTGKITTREMHGVPHHILDVCSPKKVFTAHDFVTRAARNLRCIADCGRIPIIAGGTGFYIDALLGNIALAHTPRNDTLRTKLEKQTTSQLLSLLKRKDQKRHADILQKNEQNNRVRLIRAIEVASCPRGALGHEATHPRYHVCWIGITLPDDALKQKIHARLVARLKQGMVAEARRLHTQGVSYKRMNQLGLEYRYLALFLQKKITKQELIEQLTTKIWQYARRQNTYWRKNKDIVWYTPSDYDAIEKAVATFLVTKS